MNREDLYMISEATAVQTTTFTPTYVQKQVFSLSCISNRTQDQMEADLQAWEPNIGSWNIVWGPCYTYPSTLSFKANVMFVAQAVGAVQPTYVVAIAGTLPLSDYDWMTEDLNINPLSWPYASNAGQVTIGDNDGLTNLLAMVYEGQTLQQFLSALPDKSSTSITFTGASLGGALSPMLTLALMDPASTLNTNTQNDVSLGNWAEVSLLAMAGPSMGDGTFVSYFNTVLAKASLEFIWNANDIVPHAWNAKTMMELTSPTNIYGLTLDPTQCLTMSLAQKQKQAATYSYTQFEPTPAFTGPIQPYLVASTWTPESQFLAQALYQHTIAYVNAFDCSWITPAVPDLCNDPAEANFLLSILNNKLCSKSNSSPGTSLPGDLPQVR
jgi:hypothetical protein